MTENRQTITESGSAAASGAQRPLNSYRLQLGAGFDLHAAAETAPYLHALGITDCFTSPYLAASRGSASGYDVCDHGIVQPELGGAPALSAFFDSLNRHQLGHIVDIVPNHMGTDEVRNGWWRDLLQLGQASAVGGYFDVDWTPAKVELRHKLLLPILGKPYGDALDDGDIRIEASPTGPIVRYGTHELPIDPATRPPADVLSLSREDVHALLERQAYRLAYWRTSSDEINYRRFFDVGNLVGLRMERQEVFDAAHAFLRRIIVDGPVTGLRVDHADGLAAPSIYFDRLRSLARSEPRPIVIVVEKILVGNEELPADWDVDGTTGYEFLAAMNGLFIDPSGYSGLTRLYEEWVGRPADFEARAYEARRLILSTTLASELDMLAQRLNRISERHRRSRDFTLNSLRRALAEFIAALPVYRTYLDPTRWRPVDVATVQAAAARARERTPYLESSVFRFIEAVMLVDGGPDAGSAFPPVDELDIADRRRVTERLQQFTGSVFAKGVEDTALYRCQPLLSANEVGGRPERPMVSPAEFHQRMQQHAGGLLPTTTHDTKVGADVRARLNALSELPQEWGRVLRRWRQLTKKLGSPDRNDEYRFYQALVGTWDFDQGRRADAEYVERLVAYMLKASREAKEHTSWINTNPEYEEALTSFVTNALSGRTGDRVRGAGLDLMTRVARLGVVNSLAQRVIALGGRGITDVYQGTELWDLHLVDPDNRRPVDFGRRQAWLTALEPALDRASRGEDVRPEVSALLEDWPTGRIQLFVTAAGLRLRRDMPDVFLHGAYEPLAVDGDSPGDVVAFLRRGRQSSVLAIVPRLVASLADQGRRWPIGQAWSSKTIRLGSEFSGSRLRNAFTGTSLAIPAAAGEPVRCSVADLLADVPIGLWVADGAGFAARQSSGEVRHDPADSR